MNTVKRTGRKSRTKETESIDIFGPPDVATVILDKVYHENYATANVLRIARCIRAELIFKYPHVMMTHYVGFGRKYNSYHHLLAQAGLWSEEEAEEQFQQHRERYRKLLPEKATTENLMPWIEAGRIEDTFEAVTHQEAYRRKEVLRTPIYLPKLS